MNVASMLGLGFLLGMRHATDADHVVAVTTMVTKHKRIRAAAVIGAAWGVGHTVTIGIVGGVMIVFRVAIPPRMGLFFEFLVALALITLGVLNLSGILQRLMRLLADHGMHAHLHFHGESPHVHVHQHAEHAMENPGRAEKLSTFIAKYGVFQLARPLVVGFIHGLAGSAAIAILILGSIKESSVAIAYLLIFGMGTIIGMMIVTTLIGLPIIHSAKKYATVDRWISAVSGVFSIAFGLWLAYQIGIVDGLFRLR